MSDEAPQIEDTPNVADTQAEIDWQKRYIDLQPEYTRTTQELASLRKLIEGEDPDKLREVLAKYGYELDDSADSEPDEDTDEFGEYEEDTQTDDPRIAQFEKFMLEQQEAQQQAVVNQQWDGWQQYITQQAEEAGVALNAVELNGLRLNSVGSDMMPVPPAQAEKVLKSYLEEREGWLEEQLTARKKPRVPHTPSGGQPASGGKDPAQMTSKEREAFMLERLRAESA